MPPAKHERYSITLRSLRTGAAPRDDPSDAQDSTAMGMAQLELGS